MITQDESRFAITALGGEQWRWHAVDLNVFAPRLERAQAEGGWRPEVYSVCGLRCDLIASQLGAFTYDNDWLKSRRCERCSWVVAFSRGTVEQEIDYYTPDSDEREVISAAGGDPDLLRRIFVAILADAPPGRDDEPGYRSDLLAHAARHRPTVILRKERCESTSAATVHGQVVTTCSNAEVICGACTFTAGSWADKRQGITTAECVVTAPCSVLVALSQHYGVEGDQTRCGAEVDHGEAGIA